MEKYFLGHKTNGHLFILFAHSSSLSLCKIQPDILSFSREDEIYPQPDNTF